MKLSSKLRRIGRNKQGDTEAVGEENNPLKTKYQWVISRARDFCKSRPVSAVPQCFISIALAKFFQIKS